MTTHTTTPEEQERLEEAKKILAKVNLQAQPKVLIELNRLARSEEVNFDVVADLISQDVSLSAKLLKLACSPMYSRGQKFGSVQEALMAIGFEEFRNCFTSVTLSDFMSQVGYPYKGFWDHSRRVAVLCRELANLLARRVADLAYTLGLFHDVGAVIIPLHNRDYVEHIHRALPLYFGITDLEFKMVRTNHCAVGELFCRNWGLHEDILAALRYHHRPEMDASLSKGAQSLKAILQLAELFNDKWDAGSELLAPFEKSKETLANMGDILGRDPEELLDLEPELQQRIQENLAVMGAS